VYKRSESLVELYVLQGFLIFEFHTERTEDTEIFFFHTERTEDTEKLNIKLCVLCALCVRPKKGFYTEGSPPHDILLKKVRLKT
jgi:hypothetical protein